MATAGFEMSVHNQRFAARTQARVAFLVPKVLARMTASADDVWIKEAPGFRWCGAVCGDARCAENPLRGRVALDAIKMEVIASRRLD